MTDRKLETELGSFDWIGWLERERKDRTEALAVDCPNPYCGAVAGEPCKTASGRVRKITPTGDTIPHPSRLQKAQDRNLS